MGPRAAAVLRAAALASAVVLAGSARFSRGCGGPEPCHDHVVAPDAAAGAIGGEDASRVVRVSPARTKAPASLLEAAGGPPFAAETLRFFNDNLARQGLAVRTAKRIGRGGESLVYNAKVSCVPRWPGWRQAATWGWQRLSGWWKPKEWDVAIKVITTEHQDTVAIENEVSVMQKLQTSGDVVRLFAHDLNATYKSARYPLLVMELASTDLKKLSTELGKEGPGAARPGACLPRRQVPPAVHLQMAAALLRGLGALSTAGYVHSDVKMENVFVFRGARQQNESVSVKLGDFGLAFGPEGQLSGGSWLYFSPETAAAILAVEEADFVEMQFEKLAKADVWAAGLLAFNLLAGRLPMAKGSTFHGLREDQIQHFILEQGAAEWAKFVSERYDPLRDEALMCMAGSKVDLERDLASLFSGLLQRDPAKRWGAATAFEKIQGVLERNHIELPVASLPEVPICLQ